MTSIEPMQWNSLCQLSDLVEGGGVCAFYNGKQVAVFYVPVEEERVFAIDNYDPAGEAFVLSRGIVGDLQNTLVVASPLYKHHFDLRAGRCLEDETLTVGTYPVRISGDVVEIGV